MRPTGLGITMFVVWAVGVAAAAAGPQDDDYAAARERMVTDDIAAGGVSDPRVLESLRTTPRHDFLPPAQWPRA